MSASGSVRHGARGAGPERSGREPAPVDLSVEVAGVTLPNPVMPASGTYEVADVHSELSSPSELGAVINKTIFMEAREGNPPPRIWETPAGMLNAIGIPSEGVERFVSEQLPRLRALGPPVVVSIAGNTYEEWLAVAERIESTGLADLLELDLSCPNLRDGILWATNEENLRRVVAGVAGVTHAPVIAKLSPNVRDVGAMAVAAEEAGAAAVSLVNTYQGMAIDLRTRRPALGNLTGGLSGPAIRPLAVYAVYSTYPRIRIPIIGMGGIARGEDAVQFLLAGATAVAVGTQNFVEPGAMRQVIDGIRRYLEENAFQSVRQLTGLAHRQREGA
jgi:dihydroorotate dehydrogenase (NAD+) catalytic subunit